MKSEEHGFLYVGISADTVRRLLSTDQVCAADFRCLDCRTKQCLWRLCLESCCPGTSPESDMSRDGDRVRRFVGVGRCRRSSIRLNGKASGSSRSVTFPKGADL